MKITFTQRRPKLLNFALAFFAVLAFLGSSNTTLSGQAVCTYTIQMFDSFGDGWNGGILTVNSDGVQTTHTLAAGSAGTSTFSVTDGAPIIITWTVGSFAFEPSFNLLDADGIVILSLGNPIPDGEIYNALGVCPNCPVPNPNLVVINQITDTSAHVNWLSSFGAESYLLEYGPAGFPLGAGLEVATTDSEYTLMGLNPCVDYEVYISAICGVDSVSSYIGPFTFQTTYTPAEPGDTCTYTLDLFDSFGDGWNGAMLTVMHNGVTTNFTLTGGSDGTFTFDAISNLPIEFSYTPGFFENEVSYDIIDPNGTVIFSDGPFPQVGDVFTTFACPTCPGPVDTWMSDVNATNATFSWAASGDIDGMYIIEYGPMGFTLGTGTVITVPSDISSVQLTGLMENSWYNVYITLDCGTEFSKSVGPVLFQTLWINDVGVSGITAPDPDSSCNLSANETVTVNLTNYGQAPQTLFEFYFAVNGQVAPIPVPQDGLFTGVVGNDSTQSISFETTWDFSQPGYYFIEAWTELDGDSDRSNDTFQLEILTAFPKPIQEDFEDNAISPDWTHDGIIYAPFAHNNETYVIADNVFSGDQTFTLTTNRVGPVELGDSLFFDYRYVNWFDGLIATDLGPNDNLQVRISTDCEETYETVLTINSANHVASTDMATKVILLDDFAGEAINVQFLATWGQGDYWVDLDNINVTGCPSTFGLLASIKGSSEVTPTGSISLSTTFGTEPITYLWNTGATTAAIDSLSSGIYEVTVTDANGCSETKTYQVGIAVSVDEVAGVQQISLYPNPASNTAFLDVELTERMDLQVRLFNMNGQTVFESNGTTTDYLREELDVSNQPPGMYILQVVADGKPYYAKLMVSR